MCFVLKSNLLRKALPFPRSADAWLDNEQGITTKLLNKDPWLGPPWLKGSQTPRSYRDEMIQSPPCGSWVNGQQQIPCLKSWIKHAPIACSPGCRAGWWHRRRLYRSRLGPVIPSLTYQKRDRWPELEMFYLMLDHLTISAWFRISRSGLVPSTLSSR